MDSVTVDKTELLAALRENRTGHRSAFEDAQKGWRETVIEQLDEMLQFARNGQKMRFQFSLPEPEDHTKDYDRVIRMVEMEVNHEIEIAEQDFRAYVMDDWDWMAQWSGSNSMYVARARSQ